MAQPVPSSSKFISPAKVRAKKQCCVYCGQLYHQLPRHLLQKHRDQKPVSEMSRLKPKDPQRLKIIDDLRKRGNFKHNCKSIRNASADIIVRRRSTKRVTSVDEYLPCPNCFSWSTKSSLHRHLRRCNENTKKWSRIQAKSSLLLPILPAASMSLREKVLCRMKQDDVGALIRRDSLILKYGSSLCQKHAETAEQHLSLYISTKMREIARLQLEISKVSNLTQLAHAIHPTYFDLVVSCTQKLAGYDEGTGRFSIPSLAQKIGFTLAKCANLLLHQAIVSSNDTLKKNVKDFLKLLDVKWRTAISHHCYVTFRAMRSNRPVLIPLAEDITKLNGFLSQREDALSQKLAEAYDCVTFCNLNKVIIAKLILFNRKRAGETSRILLDCFNKRLTNLPNSDIFQSLSEKDKALTKSFSHMEFRGKHGRTVPLLMPKVTEMNVTLLLMNRKAAGIPDENPYLFARLADRCENGYYNGGLALTKFAEECGVQLTKALRSTNLRKHIATMTQLMHLREHEMESVANFLGHNLSVHKEYYKLPDSALHLAKISKLLIAMGSGDVNSYKGCNLDDIDVSIDNPENLEADSGSDSGIEGQIDFSTTPPSSSDLEPKPSTGIRCWKRIRRASISSEEEQPEETLRKSPPLPRARTKSSSASNLHSTKKRDYSGRVAWTSSEIEAVESHFCHLIRSHELPGKRLIDDCISSTPALQNRTWLQVKSWLKNKIEKLTSNKF